MENNSTTVRLSQKAAQKAAPWVARLAPGLAARWLERAFLTPVRRVTRSDELGAISLATRIAISLDEERRLVAYAWGEGPVVLLVHGWSSRASQLGVYARPLVERGYSVIAFDHPAHGDADGRRTGLPELAVAVQRVAEAVGPIHGVIAHSLGAAATTVAIARGLSVDRLAYLAPPENLPAYLERLAGFMGFPGHIATLARGRIERRFGVAIAEMCGSALAPAIARPLLIVHDQADAEVPFSEGQRLAASWSGPVELLTTSGLGHNRIVRDERVVQVISDFVAGTGPTAELRSQLAC